MRLPGRRTEDSPQALSEVAHSLTFDHIVSFAMMTLFSLWQLFGAFCFG